MMTPIIEIKVPNYQIKHFEKLSGQKHFTEFGTPVAIEYWENRPDFDSISQPIIEFLRSRFLHQRIGLRMLGSQEHEGKTVENLLSIIQEIGHDRYDLNRWDNKYEKIDPKEVELFMLELEIGKAFGIDGEEQVKHALSSFYLYPEVPVRVDIGIVYDLNGLKRKQLKYKGREEIGHVFLDSERAKESVLILFKII